MSALVIHTRGDGYLGDTSPNEVAQIAAQVAGASRAVIHIHGGLVNKASGLAGAERLDSYYRAAGIVPMFPVWESGFFEAVGNNWKEIFDEKLFQELVKRLLKHAGGKLLQSAGGRGAEVYVPLFDREAEQALDDARSASQDSQREEPLLNVAPIEPPTELTPDEENLLTADLEKSTEFQDAVDAIMLGLQVPPPPEGRAPIVPIEPVSTHLSASVRNELIATAQPGARGLFDPASLITHAVSILVRIIRRFAQKRDHGFYTTVVEETLRELYLDAAGGWVWGRMKKDTEDAFVEDARAPRGGALFLRELGTQLRTRRSAGQALPQLSIVAHSAGSIWACNFLQRFASLREQGVLPGDIHIDRLIFLAPACTDSLFAQALARHASTPLFDEFRIFALSDPLEAGYWEAPPLYPRSLLYMVSGMFEGEADQPLVGMERYATNTAVYDAGDVQAVRAFITRPRQRAVWSRVDQGLGFASDALRHGAFDATDRQQAIKTMESVVYLLAH